MKVSHRIIRLATAALLARALAAPTAERPARAARPDRHRTRPRAPLVVDEGL